MGVFVFLRKDEELVEFIGEVIDPEDHCTVEFDGEDGANWGWVILRDETHMIEHVQFVGGQPLRSFIESKLNLKEAESEDKNRKNN